MNKYLRISVRNLLVAAIVTLVAFFATEFYLAYENKKNDSYFAAAQENQSVILMQMEKIPMEKTFMSATNVYNCKNTFEVSGVVPELKKGYPLIDDLLEETVQDDAINIVVIGDSFVWGAYSLNRNELFWRVLENDLRADGICANVYGVAATGANAYEELSWLTENTMVQDLKPDLVIFGYVYNDADDSVDINTTEVNWEEELPLLSKIGKLLPNMYTRLLSKILSETMYTEKYSNCEYIPLDGAPPVLKGRFYEKYKTEFAEKLNTYAENVDFPIAVMTLPTLPNNAMLEALYKPLSEIYSACGNIKFYNSLDAFNDFASSEHRGNYSVNPADFHPGSATHSFYADYIRNFIEEDFSYLLKDREGSYKKTDDIIINEVLPQDIDLKKLSETSDEVTYAFSYPAENEKHSFYGIEIPQYYLTQPIGKSHIKLSFSDSVYISDITVQGQHENVKLYYTYINESLGYDNHKAYELIPDENGKYYGSDGKKITSLLVSADCADKTNREITISLGKGGG